MSFGLAQFGLAAANSYMQGVENNEIKKEAKADKMYERGRQTVADKRAQESHDIGMKIDEITLAGQQRKDTVEKDAFDYEATYNKSLYLEKAGDYNAAADTIIRSTNQNSNIPFKVDIERDETGKVVQRTDESGNPYYYQTIYDKESGLPVGQPTAMTYAQIKDSYTQLNNGKAIADANAAYQQKLEEEQRKQNNDLSLYTAKKGVDVEAYGINKGVDHDYAMKTLGVKNVYDLEKLAVQHGYRLEQMDRQTVNSISQSLATSDINSGGSPIVGGGGNNGSVAGIIGSLTGTESGGDSTSNRTNKDGRSFGGLLQMGDARLKDYANATGTKPISAMQFKNLSAAQQSAVNNWHINDLMKAAQATGAVGKVINGTPVTIGGLVAVAHLGGKEGMLKFVQTNGKYNPSDQLGTSLTDYLRKHASGGVQVNRSVPAVPKATGGNKGNGKAADKPPASVGDYKATIDKGVNTAIKSAKTYGMKEGPATTASLSQAGNKLKQMATAKNEAEFLDLYGQAADIVIKAMPERDVKNMSRNQRTELAHKILTGMAGAYSPGNLKQIVYNVNPSAKSGGAAAQSGGMLPGQQSKRTPPPANSKQVSQLKNLYASSQNNKQRLDPKVAAKTAADIKALENLSTNMEW